MSLGTHIWMNVLPSCDVHIWTMWKLQCVKIVKAAYVTGPGPQLFSWRGCLGWEYKLENFYNLVYVNNKGDVTVALV